MKQSQVKPGVQAMFSLGGRKGSVRVTVIYLCNGLAMLDGVQRWVVEDTRGRQHVATARQLRPVPPPTDRHGDAILASMRADALKLEPARKGQTIDLGDVVIETTLHGIGG